MKFNYHFLLNVFCFRFYITGCGFVVGCLGFTSRSKHSACRPLGLSAPAFRSPGLRPSGSSSCRRDANRAVQGRMPFRVRFWLLLTPKADSQLALPDCEELNGVKQFCKNCETELHSSERCVIQDTACSTRWLLSPTWIDFWLNIALKSN